ncbi:DUF418 domain-containing protein [Nocardiopsis aegyptia]|uniref:DUF418 domain-containing protein n=1 Tax=Nocardiopsis aegyptia TaxID=220378 RepID=UPI0036719F7D
MNTPTGPPPTDRKDRKLAPDLARGAMLLLIAMAYASVYAGGGFGTDVSGEALPDRVAAFVTTLFLDNRAFPMFAILFGYGMAWMVARQTARGTADAEVRRLLRRRGLFLLLFGFVHAVLVFPGEILASYGLAALVTGWLLLRPNRVVVRAAVVFAVFYALAVPAAMILMAAGSAGGSEDWGLPGYLTVGDWGMRLVSAPFSPLFIAVAYPLLLLVVLGYLAGRAGLLDDPVAHRALLTRIAVGGVAVSLAGALPSALVAVGAVDAGGLAVGLFMGLQVLTGVCGGAGYAALFTLWSIRLDRTGGVVTRAVAAVGRRSLTFYLLNSVLVAVALHPELMGLGTRVGGAGALAVAALAWCVSLVLAAWSERTGRPGPMDALMRRLVHGGIPRRREPRPAG